MKLAGKLLAILLAALLAIGLSAPVMAAEGEAEDFKEVTAEAELVEQNFIHFEVHWDDLWDFFRGNPGWTGAGIGALIGEALTLILVFLTPIGGVPNFIIVSALLLIPVIGWPVLGIYNSVLYGAPAAFGALIGGLIGVIVKLVSAE